MKRKLLAASIIAAFSSPLFAATYQLTELPLATDAKHTYVVDVNDSGEAIGQTRVVFDLPIDISYIDFEDTAVTRFYDSVANEYKAIDKTITFTLDDIKNNNAHLTNADAHSFMLRLLASSATSAQYQKVVDGYVLRFSGQHTDEVVLFDEQSTDYDGLTRSVVNYLNSIAADGTVAGWGSAPFVKKQFTTSDNKELTLFETPWSSRGIVISPSGQKVTIEPKETQYGGFTKAMDIVQLDDGSYLVVGQSSVSVPTASQKLYDETCKGETESIAACNWFRQRNGSFYNANAYLWKLDADLNLLENTDLGLGVERREDEENALTSGAIAVNKNGIAVGFSNVKMIDTDADRKLYQTVPGYFKDGQFVSAPTIKYFRELGQAVDINDNNVMIGNIQNREIPGNGRSTVGFYVDIDNKIEQDIPGFFLGSKVAVRSINNQGYIVGQAEIDKSNQKRREEAFIYKIGDEKILNINTLLPCKDPATGEAFKYTVAEANVITENNVIYGTATKTVEKRNTKGEVVKDADGKIEYESIAVPVQLTPISGEVESCLAPEVEKYERQSASWGWMSLLLLPLVAMRRKFI